MFAFEIRTLPFLCQISWNLLLDIVHYFYLQFLFAPILIHSFLFSGLHLVDLAPYPARFLDVSGLIIHHLSLHLYTVVAPFVVLPVGLIEALLQSLVY